MPGPSFRPIMGAIGVFLLMVGLVFGGWLLVAGVISLAATLVGWLVDARKEYVRTVEADRTGHLENGPPPRTPSAMLTALAVLTLGAIFLQATVFATNEVSGSASAGGVGCAAAGRVRGSRWFCGPPSGARGRRAGPGQEHRLRPVVVGRAGEQGLHDRPGQPGPGNAPQRRPQERGGPGRVARARRSTASRPRSITSRRSPPASTRSCAPSTRR